MALAQERAMEGRERLTLGNLWYDFSIFTEIIKCEEYILRVKSSTNGVS